MSDSEATPGLDIEELIAKNPKIDRDQLREAQELIEQLERRGVRRPIYEIKSPYERQLPRGRQERRNTR